MLCSLLLSVRLHEQITAIVQLHYSIRQLQLSEYTCRWENQIIGRSISYPGTIGGAVPISTSSNRATSGWPLYVTSSDKLYLGIRERWRTKSMTKLHLCVHLHVVYMIITQTRSTMPLLLAVISEESRRRHCRHHCRHCRHHSSTSCSRPQEKNLESAQNPKSDPIWWNVYSHEKCCYQSNNLGVLIRLWEIRSGPILVRLRCILGLPPTKDFLGRPVVVT